MEKIEIDWDIRKLIEAERSGFGEPPYVCWEGTFISVRYNGRRGRRQL